MPFSGIPAGSAVEKKIDRCMARIMRSRGLDKSRAIAICRAAIPGASKRRPNARERFVLSRTTKKRTRGAAEQRAMFAKMGSDGTLFGKGGGGKRLDPQAAINAEIEALLNGLETEGGGVERDILPPPGPAPKGKGKEYQARRWINDRVGTLTERKNRLNQQLRSDRGTQAGNRRVTRNRMAVQAIDQTLEVVRHVIVNIRDADGNFADARGLFTDLFKMPKELMGNIR